MSHSSGIRRLGIGGAFLLIGALFTAPAHAQGDTPKRPPQGPPYDPRAAFAETDTNHDGVID